VALLRQHRDKRRDEVVVVVHSPAVVDLVLPTLFDL
jgi:hypothetical protein